MRIMNLSQEQQKRPRKLIPTKCFVNMLVWLPMEVNEPESN